jgi:hypothetical protein
VATIVACLAVSFVLFTGCDKEDPINPNEPSEDGDEMYYDPDDTDVRNIALRNVRIKFKHQDPDPDMSIIDRPVIEGEAMACKGRIYMKDTHDARRFARDGYNRYFIYVFDSPSLKCYSLDDNEWYQTYEPEVPYEKDGYIRDLDWIKLINAFGFYQQWAVIGHAFLGDAIAEDNLWGPPFDNAPIITTLGQITEILSVTKIEKAVTVAGVLCDEYTVRVQREETDYIAYRMLHDPTHDVTMSYKSYEYYARWGAAGVIERGTYDDYWFEITEIEYGKVKQSDIDAILNEWLKTHTPTDISDDDEHGANW